VARIALDTFGVLLPSASCAGAQRVAEQVLNAIRSEGFTVGGEPIPVTVSIAVVSPEINTETDAAGLLEEARHRLRLAVEAGGDRIQHDRPGGKTTAPAVSPQPSASQHRPVETAVAGVAEVEMALQALAGGRRPELNSAPLVRAVLPLLHAWNRAHDNQHAALIDALEAALKPAPEVSASLPADAL
jgi:hypothetical protein